MKEIRGSILHIESNAVIGHQVNLQGVMGGGLALSIRQMYPNVYKVYKEQCDAGNFKLGMIQPVAIPDKENLYIVNMAGQDKYGRGGVFTNSEALRECLRKLNIWATEKKLPIFLPYLLGCGLGGGNWSEIVKIIEEEIPDVTLVNYGNDYIPPERFYDESLLASPPSKTREYKEGDDEFD